MKVNGRGVAPVADRCDYRNVFFEPRNVLHYFDNGSYLARSRKDYDGYSAAGCGSSETIGWKRRLLAVHFGFDWNWNAGRAGAGRRGGYAVAEAATGEEPLRTGRILPEILRHRGLSDDPAWHRITPASMR